MTIKQIFEVMEQRQKALERAINATIEGNTEDDKYVYMEDDRKQMQKELTVIENTMAFLDNELYINNIKL